MTTLAHDSVRARRSRGGVAARRAVVRWTERMFRREWRQQLLVVLLLSVAVAAAIGSITIVQNSGPVAKNAAEFGTAHAVLTFNASDPHKLNAELRSLRSVAGAVDVIGHRSVPIPGSVESLDYRAQNPKGVYDSGLLALRRGSYPTGPREVAVTDGVAESLRLEIGSTLALDGTRRKVVGIVENPRRLSDEFALLPPSATGTSDYVDVLVGGDGSQAVLALAKHSQLQNVTLRGSDNGGVGTLALLSVATVFILLASLIAAASFTVVAQRRLRQLGMLAAVGATQKQIRLVLLTHGAVVGAIGAVLGTAVGVGLWALFSPTLESWLDHRIDGLSLPWGLLLMVGLLALLGATAAAWWPGRTVARLPIMSALSGRAPRPRPVRHSAAGALAATAVGVVALALSNRDRPPLIVVGLLATIFGVLLLGPSAISAVSGVAQRLPIAPRLALRDLARHQARSAAALAAVTLALGIAAAVVVVASAEEGKKLTAPPTLTDRQLRLYLGPPQARELTPVDDLRRIGALTAGANRIADGLGRASVMPLRSLVERHAAPVSVGNTPLYPSVDLATRVQHGGRTSYEWAAQLYVATPAVLRYLGIDPATIKPSTDFLLDHSIAAEQLFIPSMTSRSDLAVKSVQQIEVGRHLFGSDTAEHPPNFVTLNGLRRHGWKSVPAGWLLDASRPLTSDQIAAARKRAADAGLTVEVKRRTSSPAVMVVATGAGAILALAILAMTVGLIRAESAGDLRTLTAAGASGRIRRSLTGSTAGALAFLGALLGVLGAYVALIALYHDDLGYLSHVPVRYLALAVVGVPVIATAAGWLLAGREPPAIARAVIE